MVGKGCTPVGAYLAQDDIIRLALEHGVDMIHPGFVKKTLFLTSSGKGLIILLHRYGFLAENAAFAKKVEDAGLAFIGPQPEVIEGLGDKVKARTLGKIDNLC